MTLKSKSNNPKSIENAKDHSGIGVFPYRVIRNAVKPALRDGDNPHDGGVTNGCDGTDQRDSGNGVQVGELGQNHRSAGKQQVPLHRGERLRSAVVAAQHFVEELHAGTSHYDEGHARAAGEVVDGEDGEDLPHFIAESGAEELEVSTVAHPGFFGFVKLD